MAFGVYFHIPYCLQICPYCDFTKYEFGKIMPPKQYAELLRQEIRVRAGDALSSIGNAELDTIYFGGGTPSLFEPSLILSVLNELANAGFKRNSLSEMTIEIDPATVDQSRLREYLEIGFTRFSVGAQTFNSRLLKVAGRKHSSDDTVALLTLLKREKVNYSFDLLFALPTQTLEELRLDVMTALSFEPSHLSAYCLTVPESHPMAQDRAPDGVQVEMFHLIETELAKAGVLRYEISNFSKPGFESRHNMLYWTDQPYWGLGTGAHSYFPLLGHWGTRLWNSPSLKGYENEIQQARAPAKWTFEHDLAESQREPLAIHQALTDFSHTSLRLTRGLDRNALRLKFCERIEREIDERMQTLVSRNLVVSTAGGWALTASGRVVANTIFEHLTFLDGEIAPIP